MNADPNPKLVWHFGINYAAACLLFVVIVAAAKLCIAVPGIDADRASVRSKDLAEIRAAEDAALTTPGWVDQDRGLVRLPIAQAIQIYEKAAQNPDAARADLRARAEKAAAPPPKTTPKPSAFE
jgi:hypothetical protein